MRNEMSRNVVLCLIAFMFSVSSVWASPYFLVDSEEEWLRILEPGEEKNQIRPMHPQEWEEIMQQRERTLADGEPVPPSVFLTPDLYVYPGDNDPQNLEYPDEPGLVMAWGEKDQQPEGDYSSGFVFQYGVDPDLSNSTITLQVHPPAAIVMVSFGLTDINGNQCSWTWNTPTNIPNTPPNPATTITINTNDIPALGVNSSSPAAGSFSYNPAFDITKVVSIFINETFHSTPGVWPAPAPGGGSINFYWNAWDNFSVKPNNGGGNGEVNTKWFTKYSQPPVEIDDGWILGWDEMSVYRPDGQIIMADDWKCVDKRPVTDIHWWGSFLGWTQPYPPPRQMPKAFHIGIWSDVPAGVDREWSHPGRLLWENYCTTSTWNFAGYDRDPRPDGFENEACFQFNQFLSQDEWFRQEPMGVDDNGNPIPNVYWLSIAAIYGPDQQITHPWGWKTREHFFNDDAVRIFLVDNQDGTSWPGSPLVSGGSRFVDGQPVEFPQGVSWDLAFELTTNEPGYEDDPCPGDLNLDGIVDLKDFKIMALNWLKKCKP